MTVDCCKSKLHLVKYTTSPKSTICISFIVKYMFIVCLCVFQVAELEAQLGRPAAGQTGGEELSQSLEELKAQLSAKDQARLCPNPLTFLKGTSEREPQVHSDQSERWFNKCVEEKLKCQIEYLFLGNHL